MSQRLLVSDLQASRVPAVLNICPDDARFFQWLNEAESRLLDQGRWLGSVQEAQWCVRNDACLVFPRQVAAVEQLAVCGQPIPVQNGWYGYTRLLANLQQCAGCASSTTTRRCGCGHLQLRMREAQACSQRTTLGTSSVLHVYAAGTGDIGKTITFQGYDQYRQWKEETVTLDLSGEHPFVSTTTHWGAGAPSAVIKDVTEGSVRVYEVDGSDERWIAEYEAGETRPMYQVGYIPHLDRLQRCRGGCTTSDDSAQVTVTGLVSLQHVELRSPGDWLILRNLSAYKEAMIAVKAWEEGDEARANFHFYGTSAASSNARGVLRVVNRGGAIPLLQAELRKATADRFNAFIYTDETDRLGREMCGFR